MPESNGINTWREDSRDRKADPLGIIGWALVDKYMITGYLGSGGVGDVYEGHNVSLREQRVVVKFLKRDQDAEKFQKEAKILSLLNHPNTCGIVDFPIVESRLLFEKDTTIVYDLDDRFADVESVNFQIGVSPRLTDAMLRVGFNGHTTDYERVPIRASEKLLGRWQVAFEIVPNSAASAPMQVDSFLVRPGPTGERELVRGDRATLDFGAISWMGRRLSRVVVYWSEQ
ncbi:MAG: protein kinase [candidate division Zixibacteria bacterium]|nr:protein kinase [candidate division Zixibacteria bacterium]